MAELFKIVAIMAGASTFVAAPAFAQVAVVFEPPKVEVSGGVDFVTKGVEKDGFVLTPGPAAQGYGSVSYDTVLYGEFSGNVWISQGFETDIGNEFDVGVGWEYMLSSDSSIKLIANHYFLHEQPDMKEFTIVYTNGNFDTSYTYYAWSDGLEDGQRVNVGYNYDIDDKWSGRFDLTGQAGLELSKSITFGAELDYALTDNLSVGGAVWIPFTEEDDGRGVEFVGRLSSKA